MFELKKVGAKTWYMSAPTNVGFYLYNAPEVCMIDAGGNRDAASRALSHIREQGWRLTGVFLTHSHSDHVGGAAYLREQTGCGVYAPGISAAAVRHSFLIATTLYGGCPSPEMRSNLLLPPPCECAEMTGRELPPGLEFIRLDGHDMAQAAFRTEDGVWFTADCVVGAEALKKHRISFLYNISRHIESLNMLAGLEGELFIPAHDSPCADVSPLVRENAAAVLEVAGDIREMCGSPKTIDELIALCLDKYHIRLYLMQYLLVGQTVRSYVSRLLEQGEIEPVYERTTLKFIKTKQ